MCWAKRTEPHVIGTVAGVSGEWREAVCVYLQQSVSLLPSLVNQVLTTATGIAGSVLIMHFNPAFCHSPCFTKKSFPFPQLEITWSLAAEAAVFKCLNMTLDHAMLDCD